MAELEIKGFDELLAEVEKLGKKGNKIENEALRAAGELMKESIASHAPVRTGTLKESIAVSQVKTKDGVKHVEVGPGKEGWYGKFVEFGTVKMSANPFLEPGYEASKTEAMAAIEEELKKGLGL